MPAPGTTTAPVARTTSAPGRTAISLDGAWQLTVLDVRGHEPGEVRPVVVPGSWTLQLPGSELSHGVVRYSRTIEVPDTWRGTGAVVLCFGAVNHAATVRLDGRELGGHVGGWTPFEMVVPEEMLTGGLLVLDVEVAYPPLMAAGAGAPGMQEAPHGKQSWYGTNAGIWQPVVLEHRPAMHMVDVVVRADGGTGRVSVTARTSTTTAASAAVEMAVRRGGVTVAEAAVSMGLSTGVEVDLTATVPDPELWCPDQPALYDVVVVLTLDGEPVDEVNVTTGFRTISTARGEVLLNGQPVELRGVLDQDYHPGSDLRPQSEEELRALFGRAKELGFNLLRCHIKRPDPMYLRLADELGLLVWEELPSWQLLTPRSAAAAETLLAEMVRLDGHHPSVIAWTVVNESWGVDLRDEEQRAWMVATQQRVKELAGGALVVDNSACEPNFHVRTDLADFHAYRGIPERRPAWDAWVEQYAARPGWLFSPYGDARPTGEEPLVVSEFGNWGLPDITAQQDPDGHDPWWAEAGADWAFGAAHASRVVDRFHAQGLDDVFGSWEGFVAATQRQQLLATRYQIGSIRRRPEIAGYVLTQLSDVQWEANGLFDMDRRPRPFLEELAHVNGPSAVVVRVPTYAAHQGTLLDVTVDVVPPRGTGAPAANWRVVVRVAGGVQEVRAVPTGERSTFVVSVVLPAGPATVPVVAELAIEGDVVARDVADVAVLPPLTSRLQSVHTSDPAVAEWLLGLQVPVTADRDADVLLVTRRFDDDAQEWARRGGRALVLAEDRGALGGAFAAPLLARLSPREGDGDWVPRFDWLRRSGPFAALPGGPLFDLAFEGVIGDLVVEFLPMPLRPARLHAAVFAGWLRHNASTALTVPWSRGAVTISTLRHRTADSHDVMAAALSRAMLDVAAGR